jgi:heme-degrading monooxygenase HmoA
MIAMIFEFSFDPDDTAAYEEYLAEAGELRALLPGLTGFHGIERFESVTRPGHFVAIASFTDEDAVAAWRNTPEHRRVQALGRTRYFTDYRLRMAKVIRDYGRDGRSGAPADSRHVHG